MYEAKNLIKAIAAAGAELKTLDKELDSIAEALDPSLYEQYRAKKAAYREASERVGELRRMKREMERGY